VTSGADWLEADRLPDPARQLPARIELVEEMVGLWRLHWEEDPLSPRRHPSGRYRFDAPEGEYSVTYGNRDRLGAFAEVYGDARRIDSIQAGRRLSVIVSERSLRLVPLDDAPTQKRLGLDGRINFSKQYPVTRKWSLALHTWLSEADGIRYLSRHAGEQRNYCLFLDRCGVDLRAELRGVVLFTADKYSLVSDL
jgi:hypothetical protein